MINLGLIHCDEASSRIDGQTWWGHNASDAKFTCLSFNHKCGRIDMDDAVILPDFHGIIVHDCWGSYWKYQGAVHAVCCAHLLRELIGVEENHP